jgi:radical SAM superfamily enzyme YgiQ (UPF0313 family)
MKIYYPILQEGRRPNENIHYLLSYLKTHSKLKFTSEIITDKNLAQIDNSPENYILLSATSIQPLHTFHQFVQVLRKTLGEIKCKIIVGGSVFYILNHDDIFNFYPEVTHICVGKGEEVLKDILEKDLPSGVYHAEKFNKVNRYTLHPDYPVKDVVMLTFRDSRCSWGKCLFCHHQTRCVYPNKNAQDVADEVMYYIDQRGYRHFYFFDNHMEPETLAQFLEILYQKGYHKKGPTFYVFGIRVDGNIKGLHPILKKWPKGTIVGIAWGVEFYDQEILDRYRKGITTEQIDAALKFFPQFGTFNDVYLLHGLPSVTNENIKRQEEFIKSTYDYVERYMTSYFLLSNALIIKKHEETFKMKELDYNFTIQDFFIYGLDIPPIRTQYIDFTSWDDDLQKQATRDETFQKYLHIYTKYNKISSCPRLCFLNEITHRKLKRIRPDMYFS